MYPPSSTTIICTPMLRDPRWTLNTRCFSILFIYNNIPHPLLKSQNTARTQPHPTQSYPQEILKSFFRCVKFGRPLLGGDGGDSVGRRRRRTHGRHRTAREDENGSLVPSCDSDARVEVGGLHPPGRAEQRKSTTSTTNGEKNAVGSTVRSAVGSAVGATGTGTREGQGRGRAGAGDGALTT